MKALILETASSYPCIVLSVKEKVQTFKLFTEKKDLSKKLLLEVDLMLKEQGLTLKDLDFIALGVGPGSYTGIRIGAAFCKTISFALDIPIVPFCSLLAFIPEKSGSYICALDARSQGIYLLQGAAAQACLVSTDEAKKHFDKVDHLISPDAKVLEKKFEKAYFKHTYPNCDHLAKYVYKSFLSNAFLSIDNLKLQYITSPEKQSGIAIKK